MQTFNPNQKILIVGGGRWAKVIADALLADPSHSQGVIVWTRSNVEGVKQWMLPASTPHLLQVASDLRHISSGDVAFSIVANAAREHASSAYAVLSLGIPVLVEKPLATSAQDAHSLVRRAASDQIALAVSNVFSFAEYTEHFAAMAVARGPVKMIRLEWKDAAAEVRYGDVKRYDAGITVLADVLPHAISIISSVLGKDRPRMQGLVVERGGAEAILEMSVGEVTCKIVAARNAGARIRLIEAFTDSSIVRMDFSETPASISVDGGPAVRIRAAPPGFTPLICMINAFRRGLNGDLDHRLDPGQALQVCEFVDEIRPAYAVAQSAWLAAHRPSPGAKPDEAVRYLIREIAQIWDRDHPINDAQILDCCDRLYQQDPIELAGLIRSGSGSAFMRRLKDTA